MSQHDLFSPIALGDIQLRSRIVMAPLTRCRASAGNVPNALNAEYYRQRASAGLIISEATQVVPEGQGYPMTPGIHSRAQVEGWKMITDVVHAAGSKMVLQLWHVGRVSHPVFQPDGKLPVAPSPVAPKGQLYDNTWKKVDYVAPRALELSEIPGVIEGYVKGAENAKLAGFDGVEVHGANGYLLDQFLRDSTNKRADAYGGSVQNRARLMLEVTEAVVGVWGASRVGIRLSPLNPNNDIADSDPKHTFGYVARELEKLKLAYVHVLEDVKMPAGDEVTSTIKAACGAPVVANFGYTLETAQAAIREGRADAIAFGKLFIANPDLPKRLAAGGPFNEWDMKAFYGGTEKGYTDYPALG
jgi:N-ethylmaleimide reductase